MARCRVVMGLGARNFKFVNDEIPCSFAEIFGLALRFIRGVDLSYELC